jgi:hypothetical protein
VRSQISVAPNVASSAGAFEPVVAELDAADAAYRAAIGAILPTAKAHAVLEALTSFRARAAEVRAEVRRAFDFGDFDPLDTYAPDMPGSHGESVRRSSSTDGGRAEVAALRSRLNAQLAELLERAEIERLIAAKGVRNAAFDRSVRAALPPSAGDKLATQLLLLVDGWY